jgi:hypothetical protein
MLKQRYNAFCVRFSAWLSPSLAIEDLTEFGVINAEETR